MDYGYMTGPREAVFKLLAEFAEGIKEGTGCEMVARKCMMYSLDVGRVRFGTRKK
jgi:hypothetical protein